MTKTLEVGDTFKITATTKPTGVPAELVWEVDGDSVEMTYTGKTATVTAKKPGRAKVKALLKDVEGLTAETAITVKEAPTTEPEKPEEKVVKFLLNGKDADSFSTKEIANVKNVVKAVDESGKPVSGKWKVVGKNINDKYPELSNIVVDDKDDGKGTYEFVRAYGEEMTQQPYLFVDSEGKEHRFVKYMGKEPEILIEFKDVDPKDIDLDPDSEISVSVTGGYETIEGDTGYVLAVTEAVVMEEYGDGSVEATVTGDHEVTIKTLKPGVSYILFKMHEKDEGGVNPTTEPMYAVRKVTVK